MSGAILGNAFGQEEAELLVSEAFYELFHFTFMLGIVPILRELKCGWSLINTN